MWVQHYRQPVKDLSNLAYIDGLRSITPELLDAACRRALETSEFMPVVATIRECAKAISAEREGDYFLGEKQLTYPEITEEERAAALEYSEKLRAVLLVPERPAPPVPTKKTLPPRPQSMLSIEEQKRILRERGLL